MISPGKGYDDPSRVCGAIAREGSLGLEGSEAKAGSRIGSVISMSSKIPLTTNARRVLEARYLRRDARGRLIETPEELFARVATAVGEAGRKCDGEDHADAYRAMLSSLDFLPNSPTLMNAGTGRSQLSACFVLPVEDSMEGIFETLKRMALIQRTGGGTGFSFSSLRPRGSVIGSAGGESSGAVSFLRLFDQATKRIRQGGKRRGANMGVLRVDHPDILEFVRLKTGRVGTMSNFNLSVGITDEFMNIVEEDGEMALRHQQVGEGGWLVARQLFESMAQAAWDSGDPGLIFLDAINRANPTPLLGRIEATNPCGEVPLLPYEACNLGSLNLARMVVRSGLHAEIDWPKLERTVRLAIRFLDDVIEACEFPFEEIDQMVRGNRKIGLGVMGFAELLILLGVSYDSDEAVALAGKLMEFIAVAARAASCDLAEARGVYPNWSGSLHETAGQRLRNATCTAIAPTGTIGIIAGTSAGIEPLFALVSRRRHGMGGEVMLEENPRFLECLEGLGKEGRRILEEVRKKGCVGGVRGVPAGIKSLFIAASEIPPGRHLEIQAAFQHSVDNAVSKTINLPASATPRDIERIYFQAWRLGLKGITVYRAGSKPGQVIELGAVARESLPERSVSCSGECSPAFLVA